MGGWVTLLPDAITTFEKETQLIRKSAFFAIGLLAVMLSGCTSDYVISTKSGDAIISHGEPDKDRNSGMTSYTDLNGDYHLMNTNDIADIRKK